MKTNVFIDSEIRIYGLEYEVVLHAPAAEVVACVNACAGIPDPETTIPELVDALRAIWRYREDPEWAREQEDRALIATDGNVTYFDAIQDKARAVLAKLDKED